MRIKCEQIWPEISNYLDGDVDANLRPALETHFRKCNRCQAVRDGTRNVMLFYGDDRMIEAPLGFSHWLQRTLEEREQPNRRSFLEWVAAVAASLVVTGQFRGRKALRFQFPGRALAPRPAWEGNPARTGGHSDDHRKGVSRVV
jgi:hypothetical protein